MTAKPIFYRLSADRHLARRRGATILSSGRWLSYGTRRAILRAAFYTQQGAARDVLRVGDLPMPAPAPGEVRVKLHTSGVNPSDWKIRRGGFGRGLLAPLVVPHSDGAGEIDAVGEGVRDRIGERVWIWNGQWKRPHGTAAEFIVLPSDQAIHLPDAVDFAAGACLGIPALTAVQAVRLAGVANGTTVLIAGGAGSVAHYAIQFAKLRGARVLTTVSGEAKAAHAKKAGADEIINYRTEDIGERVRALTGACGVEAVIEMDLTRNSQFYPAILSPHATVVIYGMSANEATLPSLWLMQNSITLRFFLIYDVSEPDRRAGIDELTKALVDGHLIHTIAHRLPLDRVAEAHEIVESGNAIGNVVLEIA
jgi:NADPH2:quinone reductase